MNKRKIWAAWIVLAIVWGLFWGALFRKMEGGREGEWQYMQALAHDIQALRVELEVVKKDLAEYTAKYGYVEQMYLAVQEGVKNGLD